MATGLDALLAAEGADSDYKPNFFEGMVDDTKKSLRAAGMMLRLYEPEDDAERKELTRRFIGDAAMLGVSIGGGALVGAALKGAAPVARMILAGALGTGAGSGAQAAIEGEPVLPATLTGAAIGAIPLGGIGAVKQAGKQAARGLAGDAATIARKEFIAKTMGELNAPGTPRAHLAQELTDLYKNLPSLLSAEREQAAAGTAGRAALSGAEQGAIDPASLPLRSRATQHGVDPFSLPQN